MIEDLSNKQKLKQQQRTDQENNLRLLREKLRPKVSSRYLMAAAVKTLQKVDVKIIDPQKRLAKRRANTFVIKSRQKLRTQSIPPPMKNLRALSKPITLPPLNPISGPIVTKRARPSSTAMTQRKKYRSFPHVTDVGTWLKKNQISSSKKVFICSSIYRKSIRRAFLKAGWVQNKDSESTCFHLKFSLKGSQIPFDMLESSQIVNHFQKVQCLTIKAGLTRSLRSLTSFASCDLDAMFPRSYDCNNKQDYEEFLSYYKVLRAECVLKKFLYLAQQGGERDSEDYLRLLNLVGVALKITQRRLLTLEEVIESHCQQSPITDKEWKILSEGEVQEDMIAQMVQAQSDKRYKKMMQSKNKKKKKRRKKKKKKTIVTNNLKKQLQETKENKDGENSKIIDEKMIIKKSEDEENDPNNNSQDEDDQEEPEIELNTKELEVQDTLSRIKEKYPQTNMNGMNNIWIIKPSGLSRGRGIKLLGSLAEITHHLQTKDFSFVIQKYMENPMLYKRKKFDIRQWVLVADWNPLTILFFEGCYVRVTTNEFTLKNIKNRFIHLTNNSVNKNSKNFNEDDGFLSVEDFETWIVSETGEEDAYQNISIQMKKQVKNSLKCCQEQVVNRKNSVELFGYDFCVDEAGGVWLIEVNASPDLSFSSVSSWQC